MERWPWWWLLSNGGSTIGCSETKGLLSGLTGGNAHIYRVKTKIRLVLKLSGFFFFFFVKYAGQNMCKDAQKRNLWNSWGNVMDKDVGFPYWRLNMKDRSRLCPTATVPLICICLYILITTLCHWANWMILNGWRVSEQSQEENYSQKKLKVYTLKMCLRIKIRDCISGIIQAAINIS